MANKNLNIHFDTPAKFDKWESQALPVGNGYMGATIFGGLVKEKIVLNEKTLWKGGPSKYRPDYGGGNKKNAYLKVREVQKLLANNEYEKAVELLPHLTGEMDGIGHYLLFCDAYIEFKGIDETKVNDYNRYLNLNTASAGVSFKCNSISYTREIFASYPDRIIALKLNSSEKNLCFELFVDNLHDNCKINTSENQLHYFGELDDNQLRYYGIFRIETDGNIAKKEKSLSVENADSATIYISMATDYSDEYPHFRSGIDPYEIVTAAVENAVQKGYESLKADHIKDFAKLFDRVEVNIFQGDENERNKLDKISTNSLLEKYRTKESQSLCSYLEEIYFQYGRYLLISSSREGSLPANLQGVWNESNNPPWGCDYHLNVNLQMNYWHAYSTNIAETAIPLIRFLESLRKPGRNTAKEYYNIISDEKNPENGWTAHTQSTPFGWTTPGWDFYWGWSTAAVAWLMQNIWEYYEFTEDKDLLEKEIYPIMRESALFYKQWLIWDEKQKRFVSTPTYSPEHGPVTVGNTYEQSLIEQAFIDFIKAAEILGKDQELCNEIKEITSKLYPFHISKKGLLKEWYEEDEESFDTAKVEKHHRHISHLMALYPGKMISPEKPDILKASIATLNDRGDDSTGWARAYKLNLWARTGDGNRAYKLLWGQIASCTYENLFDFHPPFQIDGNFGASAGISEMLLQSQWGYIEVLPAKTDAWKNGSFKGLCARGGFEISAEWKNKKVNSIEVFSKKGNTVKIKTDLSKVLCNKKEVNAHRDGDFLIFNTKASESYCIC